MHSLKEKIDWLLEGNYLIDTGKDKVYAYALDLDNNTFYAVAHRSVDLSNPNRYLVKKNLPLDDIANRMDILFED